MVQVLGYVAVRMLDALVWVALTYMEELGITLDHVAIRLVQLLGDGPTQPSGGRAVLRGPQRLLDLLMTQALPVQAEDAWGDLLSGIVALLNLDSGHLNDVQTLTREY